MEPSPAAMRPFGRMRVFLGIVAWGFACGGATGGLGGLLVGIGIGAVGAVRHPIAVIYCLVLVPMAGTAAGAIFGAVAGVVAALPLGLGAAISHRRTPPHALAACFPVASTIVAAPAAAAVGAVVIGDARFVLLGLLIVSPIILVGAVFSGRVVARWYLVRTGSSRDDAQREFRTLYDTLGPVRQRCCRGRRTAQRSSAMGISAITPSRMR